MYQNFCQAPCWLMVSVMDSGFPASRVSFSISFRREEKETLLWLEMISIEHALVLLSDQTTFVRDCVLYVTCMCGQHSPAATLNSMLFVNVAQLSVSDNSIRHAYWILRDNWFQKPVYFVHDHGWRLHQTSFWVRAESSFLPIST